MHGRLDELQMGFLFLFRKANLFMLFNMPTRKGTWNGHFKKIMMSIQHIELFKNNITDNKALPFKSLMSLYRML